MSFFSIRYEIRNKKLIKHFFVIIYSNKVRSGVGGPQDRARDRGILRSRDENFGF